MLDSLKVVGTATIWLQPLKLDQPVRGSLQPARVLLERYCPTPTDVSVESSVLPDTVKLIVPDGRRSTNVRLISRPHSRPSGEKYTWPLLALVEKGTPLSAVREL